MADFSEADLRAELAALQRARWAGSRRVLYEGNGVRREIEFKSDIELASAIADLERRISGPTRKTVVLRPVKGWLNEGGLS